MELGWQFWLCLAIEWWNLCRHELFIGEVFHFVAITFIVTINKTFYCMARNCLIIKSHVCNDSSGMHWTVLLYICTFTIILWTLWCDIQRGNWNDNFFFLSRNLPTVKLSKKPLKISLEKSPTLSTKNRQILLNFISPTIRIGQEIQCLP